MPVLVITLDIGPYEDQPSNAFEGFVDRLTSWLPGLETHECSVGRPGGFIERLNRGTYLAHICEHVALELQCVMGFNVSFGRARGSDEYGVYRVVMVYVEEEPAREAFATAVRLSLAAMHDEPFDVAAEFARLMAIAKERTGICSFWSLTPWRSYTLSPVVSTSLPTASRRRNCRRSPCSHPLTIGRKHIEVAQGD